MSSHFLSLEPLEVCSRLGEDSKNLRVVQHHVLVIVRLQQPEEEGIQSLVNLRCASPCQSCAAPPRKLLPPIHPPPPIEQNHIFSGW